MLSGKSNVNLVGVLKQTFQDGGSSYKVAFTGTFTPRYGELIGSVAGVCECTEDMYKLISLKKLPYSCTGVIIQDSRTRNYELADVSL